MSEIVVQPRRVVGRHDAIIEWSSVGPGEEQPSNESRECRRRSEQELYGCDSRGVARRSAF